MSWDDLIEGSLDGIEIPIQARRVSGGHDVGRARPVGVGGQRTEPLGALPLAFVIEVPLYASVSPDHYPARYIALCRMLRDNDRGGAVRYVDPVFGPVDVQIIAWSTSEEATHRDGALVSISMEERTAGGADSPIGVAVVERSTGAAASALAVELDVALADAGVLDTDVSVACSNAGYPLVGAELSVPDGALLSGIVDEYVARLSDASATIDVVRGIVDEARARVEALLSLPSVALVESWGIRRSLVLLYDSIAETGRESIGRLGIEADVSIDGSERTAHEVAESAMGDASRWADVVVANSEIRNPLRIPSGSSLSVYVRPGGGS